MNVEAVKYLRSLRTVPSHRNFMMTDGAAVNLTASYYTEGLTDLFDGVVWIFRWRDIETSEGVYNFSTLDATLNYLGQRGKQCIPRLFLKSFLDPNDPPTSGDIVVPDYVLNNHALYGGATGSGGMLRGYKYTNGVPVWQGWTVDVTNSFVQARIKALVEAVVERASGYLAHAGFCYDEFVLGLYHDVWPSGMSTATQDVAIKSLITHAAAVQGASDVYIGMNYLDADPPPNYPAVKAMAQWIHQRGIKLMLPDVFSQELPVYAEFQRVGNGIGTIDSGDRGADDAGLQARTDATYQRSRSLNSAITAWYYHGPTSNYWTTAKTTIAAFG